MPCAYRTALVTSSDTSSSAVGMQLGQAPAPQRPPDQRPGPAGRGQLRRQGPAHDVVGRDPAQPRDQHRDVVAVLVGVDAGEGRPAQVLQRLVAPSRARRCRAAGRGPRRCRGSASRPGRRCTAPAGCRPRWSSTRLWISPVPTPSGGAGSTSSSSLVPSGRTSSGGRWPAEATSQVPATASKIAYTQVAKCGSRTPSSCISSFSCCSVSAGGSSSIASVWIAVRSRPMVTAARTPCPATSPTTSATRAPGSAIDSYQSPPTSISLLPGR